MKKIKTPLSIGQSILLALALTLLCVGGAAAAVFSYQEPDRCQELIQPLLSCVQRLSEAGQAVWSRWSGSVTSGVHSAAVQLRETLDLLAAPPALEDGETQLVDGGNVAPPPRSRASSEITTLIERDGQEYLTGGAREIVYYDQTSERWSEELYGTDPIGGYGCGPTAMAMAVSTLSSSVMDPVQMAQHCVDSGYWARKHGSYRSIVSGVAEDFGLVCTSLPPEEADSETVIRCLANGQLMVALMGPGHFTNVGHFILLRGVTMDGSILVADPASPERSLTVWDLDLILSELSPSRDSGGPLWVLSENLF